jgi:deoxyribodipyrimidine photo-lyase
VVCLFVFDETVLAQSPANDKRLGFLIDALKQLDTQLVSLGSRLYVAKGSPETLIPAWIQKHSCDALFYNKSYGPRSQTRDRELYTRCANNSIANQSYDDFLMLAPGVVEQRKVFTPFYNLRKKQVAAQYPELVQ